MTSRPSKKAQRFGFKTEEEYIVFSALKKNDLDVRHNVSMLGTEIDLFIPPNIIIEIGFRDEYLMEKWDDFVEKGYEFFYISNIEANNPESLTRHVNDITRLVEETNVNSYRWKVTGFGSTQRDSVCYSEATDDGLDGVIACLESALRKRALSVIVTRERVLEGKTHVDATHISSARDYVTER